MVQYINDTQHDKIQRGLRTGIALLTYGTKRKHSYLSLFSKALSHSHSLLSPGRQDEAEPWITKLLEAKSNAVLRQAGVCSLAMAYAGTGNASVVKRLLAKVRFSLSRTSVIHYFFHRLPLIRTTT